VAAFKDTDYALLVGARPRGPGMERADLLARLTAGTDDVYLFALEVEGLPEAQRWSLAHPKGRAMDPTAALFFREALRLDGDGAGANNLPAIEEDGQWSSRGTTTRQ